MSTIGSFEITPLVKREIVRIIDERIEERHIPPLREDFSELKAIVQNLGINVGELAIAQKRTENEIQDLTKTLKNTNVRLGGLSESMGYAFENEVYRMLPPLLKERFGIEMVEKFVRKEIGKKEINIFGRARRNGKEIIVLGEAKLRLPEHKDEIIEDIFKELDEKIDAVKTIPKDKEIIRLFVTHYATNKFFKEAKKRDIIVIQSFGR